MADSSSNPDVIVIGAGIAGLSLAAELAADARVAVVEAESQPCYHSTGRSAAVFTTGYGPPCIRALSRASGEFLKNPDSFSEVDLMRRFGLLFIGREDQHPSIAALHSELSAEGSADLIGIAEARERFPLLRKDYAKKAIWFPEAWDIDVDALASGYMRRFKQQGGVVLTGRRVTGLDRSGSGWTVQSDAGEIHCGILVNASGAWADEIAGLAGAEPAGIVPKKRTAATIRVPDNVDIGAHCMVVDVDEEFYAKPGAGQLLISPADESPVPAGDAYADELDVAVAADRIQKALDLDIQRIESSWAGLRSFAPDGCPVIGFDAGTEGFFWCAGQGGYGIQSAPALSRLAAAQLLGRPVPDDILSHGLQPGEIDAARFAG